MEKKVNAFQNYIVPLEKVQHQPHKRFRGNRLKDVCSDPDQKTIVGWGVSDLQSVNLSRPRAHLHCAAPGALPAGWCCAAHVPWLWDGLHQLTVNREPAGSNHCGPAIKPPAWPCRYLKIQQEVLMPTSFLSDSRNDK